MRRVVRAERWPCARQRCDEESFQGLIHPQFLVYPVDILQTGSGNARIASVGTELMVTGDKLIDHVGEHGR